MPSRVILNFADYGNEAHPNGETSHVAFEGVALTAGNFAAQTALMDTLVAATAAIQEGVLVEDKRMYNYWDVAPGPATAKSAQRERKWLLRFHDDVSHEKFKSEVPCGDSSLLKDHSEQMDLAAGAGLAFKNAFEAFVVSPVNPAHAVILDSATLVGRNL